ncbi:hypothetical protein DWX43_18355 [Clostridium sp. AF19-22AC]|nr:hypothetical protein DWX43_18355 [Clostridium sp. AF19-22AC]
MKVALSLDNSLRGEYTKFSIWFKGKRDMRAGKRKIVFKINYSSIALMLVATFCGINILYAVDCGVVFLFGKLEQCGA